MSFGRGFFPLRLGSTRQITMGLWSLGVGLLCKIKVWFWGEWSLIFDALFLLSFWINYSNTLRICGFKVIDYNKLSSFLKFLKFDEIR